MGNSQGEAGETRETELGEPREAAAWSLHTNKNSKNPSKHILVGEHGIYVFMYLLLFQSFHFAGGLWGLGHSGNL